MPTKPPDLTVCPICHVIETTPEFPDARGPARRTPLVRCRRCGLVFQERVRPPEELDPAEQAPCEESQNRFSGMIEGVIRLFRLSRVRLATRLMPAGGHTLDIGCGRALYLRMLNDRGYQVRGTEVSPAAAADADPQVPVDVGEIRLGHYPDASFDLISIWHVLEHLRTPDLVLEACARALKPQGALLIAVPNYGSIQARIGGEEWLHLDLPRHVFQFTEATLQRLLAEHDFEIERSRTGQWEMDPFGLLQTVLNRTGLRHNALFDTLRNQEEIKQDLSWAYRAAMLLVFPIGMLLSVPASLLFRALNRAGTLIVVARSRGGVRT